MQKIWNEELQDYICHVGEDIITLNDVIANPDYTLTLTFSTGEKKLYDVKPLLSWEIFEPLTNLDLFLNVKKSVKMVYWNDKLDIAPEHLYENSVLI